MVKKILIVLLITLIVCEGIYIVCKKKDTIKRHALTLQHKLKGEKKRTFTFWTIQLKAPAGSFIKENINAFKALHPEIDVVWVDIPIAEAQKRTLASILGGNPPDLINLNPDFSSLLAQKGVLEYFSDEELEPYHPELTDKLRYEGRVFAIPFYATSSVTLYNKKLLNECINDASVETYDDLYVIAPALRKCTNIPVFAANLNENDTFSRILNKYDIFNFYTKQSINDALNVYSIFDEMYKKGYMPKDTLTINHREVAEKYMSNNAIFVVVGSNFIKMVKENAPDIYTESAISTQLSGPSRKYDVALMNLIIPKSSKNKNLAKEFAFMLTSYENQLKFAKLTNVLPANKEALKSDYFTNCPDELFEAARCISAKQLDSLVKKDFGYNNKKEINDILNRSLETVLLTGADIEKTVDTVSKQVRILQGD